MSDLIIVQESGGFPIHVVLFKCEENRSLGLGGHTLVFIVESFFQMSHSDIDCVEKKMRKKIRVIAGVKRIIKNTKNTEGDTQLINNSSL